MGKLLAVLLFLSMFLFSGCYSCQSWHNFWNSGPVEPYGAERAFWDSECKPIVAEPAPAPAQDEE